MSSPIALDLTRRDSATPLRVAVGVSILLHILIFMPGFARVMTGEEGADAATAPANESEPTPASDPQRPDQPREIRLGIAESASTTLNWIGYREYEEHLAQLAEIDQAALRMSAAGPEGPPSDAPDEGPEVGPTEVAQATPPLEPTPPTPPIPVTPPPTTLAQATPPVDRPPQDAPPAPSEPAAEVPAGTRPDAPPEPPSEPVPEPAPQSPEPEPEPKPEPEPAPQPEVQPEEAQPTPPAPPTPPVPPSRPSGGGSRGAEDPVGSGDRAEAEADPTSIQNVPTNLWRNGRPIAAQGLTIRTRKPRFTVLTMVTARPVNPIVEIKFDREGRPRHYDFLRRSGHPDVDGPILDAIAGWRANGEVLEALRPGDTVAVRLRLILQE